MTGNPDIIQLRQLLLGKDYDDLLRIKSQFENSERYSEHVADIIAEALTLRSQKDDAITQALNPIIEQSLNNTIHNDPKRFADVLYPAMGPAIRKSINQSLSDTLAHFNQVLEESLSLRSLRWRFDAWRTGQSYAQVMMMKTLVYQVEQVFLIHRESGLLIEHLVSDNATSKDPDMVSGMLTAIQDFIKDSFSVDHDDHLSHLKLGELTVLIEHHPYAVTALVVRGTVPAELQMQLRETSETIHQQYGRACRDFNGDTSGFTGVAEQLRPCLVSQKQASSNNTAQDTKKRTPWLMYGLLTLGIGLTSYWLWHNHQKEQRELQAHQQILQQEQQLLLTAQKQLDAEPGIALLATEKTEAGYHLKGFVDLHARRPDAILTHETRDALGLSFDFEPYISMDEGVLLERVKTTLQTPPAPHQVSFSLQGRTLQVSGTSNAQWYQYLQQSWSLIPGLEGLHTGDLVRTDLTQAMREQQEKQRQHERQQRALQTSIQKLETQQYRFEKGKTAIDDRNVELQQTISHIKALITQARALQQQIQITLFGHTDETGNTVLNQKLAKQRAQQLRETLIKQGIPAAVLVAYGSHDEGLPTSIRQNTRSVSYRVQLF